MKSAPLTLLLAWAVQAHADTTLPTPATGKPVSWADSCAARIDAAAKSIGFEAGARASVYPLVHEDGKPNPVYYVEYAARSIAVEVGDDAEPHADQEWRRSPPHSFRRYKHRFGKIFSLNAYTATFKAAVDDCLKMGEPK